MIGDPEMRIYTYIKSLIPLVACLLIATAGTSCDDGVLNFKETRKAAEQGGSEAQFNLGQAYNNGEGVPQDYKEAIKWFRKAAEQGDARAQFALGYAYNKGEGVPQNKATSYAWFNVAVANGEEKAKDPRDTVAILMTPEQLAEAQALSAKWFELYQPKE
jgi:uncharacterized protein